MSHTRFGDLEVIERHPKQGPAASPPLLFVHGAYTGAWCWDEHFLPWFAARGHSCYAVSLSGHGNSRRNAGPLDAFSIRDYVDDVLEVTAQLPVPPILIGHSMGGLVVQKYLEQAAASAVVLLCSVPPQGLMGSAFGIMFNKPGLLTDLNRILGGERPNPASLREALFHQPIDEATLMRYYQMCQPESHRAFWDMTLFNLPQPGRMARPPMLVMGAQHDHLIPPSQVHMTASTYGVESQIIPDMGHSVMLERDWEQVATHIATWLETHAS